MGYCRTIKIQVYGSNVLQVQTNIFRGAVGALIVFGLDDRNSFTELPRWIKEVKELASPEVKIIIAGNKCDLNEKDV